MASENKKFLVIVIDRISKETLAEYNNVVAVDWYYARSQVVNNFPKEFPELAKMHNWCCDSLELE